MNPSQNAKKLRKSLTDAELILWKYLRKRQLGGHKFRKQHPVGNYIVDFVCLKKKLIIELDGGQHQKNIDYDTKRTQYLELEGFKVVRFWNNQVFNEIDEILDTILNLLITI